MKINKLKFVADRFLLTLLAFISCLAIIFGCFFGCLFTKDAMAENISYNSGNNSNNSNNSNIHYSWPQQSIAKDKLEAKTKDEPSAKVDPIPSSSPNSSSIIIILNSIKKSLDQINHNISSSQDTLSKMNDKLDKANDNQKDYWNNYVKMESKSKYPKKPFPAWQVFVDQSKSQDSSLSNNSMLQFVDSLTNNNAVKSNLVSANQAGLDGSLYYPLNIGLGRSIPNANALQSSRLNTMLVLQTYKLQLIQVQALNRVTQLLNVLIVNNNQAQSAQLSQLRKIHKALVKT